eukprot:1145909-Pelagomonas_calceolata.AAC.1
MATIITLTNPHKNQLQITPGPQLHLTIIFLHLPCAISPPASPLPKRKEHKLNTFQLGVYISGEHAKNRQFGPIASGKPQHWKGKKT